MNENGFRSDRPYIPGYQNTVDPYGGIIGPRYRQEGEGEQRLSWEVAGENWALVEGSGFSPAKTEVSTRDGLLKVVIYRPFMTLDFSRDSGTLLWMNFSVVDLVSVAGTKSVLAPGDLTSIGDLRAMGVGIAISLSLVGGIPRILLSNSVGNEIRTVFGRSDDFDQVEKFGFIKNGKGFLNFVGDFGNFRGKIEVRVYPDRVVCYYEKVPVYEIPRECRGVCRLDEVVTRRMPSEDEMLEFMGAIFPEVK